MNKVKIIILSVLFLLFINSSFAKKTILPAYIITNEKDTIDGFIDFKEWKINPNQILFKKSSSDKGVNYSPINITEFSVSDEIYKSAIVKVEQSSIKTNELSDNPVLKYKTDTVFLQAIITGKKELFFLKDNRGKDHFYIKEGSDYNWLIHKKYYRDVDGKKLIATNNKYIGQLILYLDNCNSINSILSAATYDQNSLREVFQKYYECTDSRMVYQVEKTKLRVDLGALAGVSLTKLKFNGSEPHLTEVDFPLSTNFMGGISANLFFPRNLGRWSINNELIFTSLSTNANYEEYFHENRYVTYETSLGFTYLKLNNMLRGNFKIDKVLLFFNVGISNGFVIASTNELKKTSVLFDQKRIDVGPAMEHTRTYEQGLIFGFGAGYKKFSGEFRYELGNGMSNYSDVSSVTNRYYFFLSYRFL